MRSHYDNLARELLPAVAALVPGSAIEQARRADYALTREGKVNPHALLLSGSLVISGLRDLTVTSTASTVTYATSTAKINLDLPEGTWSVLVFACGTAGNTLSSTVDFRIRVNGQTNSSPATITGSTSNLSAIQDLIALTSIDGNQTLTIETQVKVGTAGSGTSSVRDVILVALAWRQ